MDTYNMELDSIIESLNMDIFSIEHENFMNIMYSRSEGILNESVLLEFKQSKIKIIINKIKEAFGKLAEKVKEIIEKFTKAIQDKFFSLKFNELKQLPDDINLGKRINFTWVEKWMIQTKKTYQTIEQICDKISKINTKHISYANTELDIISDIFDKFNEEGINYTVRSSNIDRFLEINGAYLKREYPKILISMKDSLKMGNDLSKKLYKSLKDADHKVDDLGKNFTTNVDANIQSKEYNGDKNNNPDYVQFAKKYIELYKNICRLLATAVSDAFVISQDCKDIILKALSLLGDKAKNHPGYNYNMGGGMVGGRFNPDPDFDDDLFED